MIIDTYHLGYCLGCLNIISSDHPYSDASRLTSRDLYKRKREKTKAKNRGTLSPIQSSQVKSARDKSSQEETSVIDSNIREENRVEEYAGTTNLKVQCNTSQVYDQ